MLSNQTLKENLTSLLIDLEIFIDKVTPHRKKPSILFATKYLNKHQFVSFIQILVSLSEKLQGHPLPKFLIGENRVQDAEDKIAYLLNLPKGSTLRKSFTFVMIGNLQKNKINKALSIFDEIHSVDSIESAEKINNKVRENLPRSLSLLRSFESLPYNKESESSNKIWRQTFIERRTNKTISINKQNLFASPKKSSGEEVGKNPLFARSTKRLPTKLPIFLEVNLSGEPSKHGFKPEELNSAISTIKQFSAKGGSAFGRNHLIIRGLLTMPPFTQNPETSRPYFRKLRQIRDSLNSQLTTHNLQLSMGTSQDWPVAIEEDADIIRVGSTIFSPPKPSLS